jgi:hypothetical protein
LLRPGAALQLAFAEMQQHQPVRQKFRYFGVIAIVTIVTLGLFWGFAHI